MPPGGSQRSWYEKIISAKMPTKKDGAECRNRAVVTVVCSSRVPRFHPATAPMIVPSTTLKINAGTIIRQVLAAF